MLEVKRGELVYEGRRSRINEIAKENKKVDNLKNYSKMALLTMRSPLGNVIPSSRKVTICVIATTSSVPGGGSFTPEFGI